MARKGRHSNRHPTGGGATPGGFRPRSGPPAAATEPDLVRDLRRAGTDDHPLNLLMLVSSLLSDVDPRNTNPFDERPPGPSRDELLRTFMDIDQPESSLVLAGIAALSPDEVERRRIMRILEQRHVSLPPWMDGLSNAEAYRTVEMVHVLRDGDNVVVGVRFPQGQEITAVVYIDHNLGTLIKDAYVLALPIDIALSLLRTESGDDPDTAYTDIQRGDARARIEAAGDLAAHTYPPFETDMWPLCRPLIEWVARLLPDDGVGYDRPAFTEGQRQAVARRFMTSPSATGLMEDDRMLVELLIRFGCDAGPGDPLRWSAVAVELVLVDWIPRKVTAPVTLLTGLPQVLRAFIRFSHAERGIRAALTTETLEAVDRWDETFQMAIRTPRPHGAAAILASVGVFDPDGPWIVPSNEWADYELDPVAFLEKTVGGAAALAALDDDPLPDEPFDWSAIDVDLHDRVADMLAMCDSACDDLMDVEYRTACRRLLAHLATAAAKVVKRGQARTSAAAVCWSIASANDLIRPGGGGSLAVGDLMAHFGIRGSVSSRAMTLLLAAGFTTGSDVFLESPAYLVSSYRREVIEAREEFRDASS